MSPTKRRAPGDGGLFKRKSDGLWVGSVEIPTADGKRRQKRVAAKDYKKAKAKQDELRKQVDAGIIPVTASTTVAQWLDHWLTEVKKPHVSPNTFDWYEEAVRLHIVPNLDPKLRLNRLTAQHVRIMLAKVNTPPNAQRAHKTLKMALATAVTDGVLARNVVDAVDKPAHIKVVRDALPAAAAKDAIRAGIALEESGDGPSLATRWAAAFLTGARPAEILGLEWDRVDLAGGAFDFSWQLLRLKKVHGCGERNPDKTWPCGRNDRPGYCPQAKWDLPPGYEYRECYKSMVWARPKTSAGTRIVPIVAPLLEMLKRHAQHDGPNPHNLVWHEADGRPIAPKVDREAWRQVRDTAKLPDVPIYTSRHTAATLLQELGVSEEVRMQIMGQSSAAAHRGYVHIDQAQTRAALGKLERLLLQAD